MTEQQQKQQQQNDDEKLKIAEKVFNPQVAQFVPSEDISYEISVHPDLMPHIIGTHGSNLSRLSSKFARWRIQLGREGCFCGRKNETNLIIMGQRTNIDATIKDLNESLTSVAIAVCYYIPSRLQLLLFGRSWLGQRIQYLISIHHVMSMIENEAVTFTGLANNVEAFRLDFEPLLKEFLTNVCHIHVHVNINDYPSRIGTRQSIIDKLETEYDVSISGFVDDDSSEIVITGFLPQCECANIALRSIMVGVSLVVAKRYHRCLIGPKGANVTKMMKDYGVALIFPSLGDPSNMVVVKGFPQDVDKTCRVLETQVAELIHREKTDFALMVPINPVYLVHLILHYKNIQFKLYEKCQVNFTISKKESEEVGNAAFHAVIRGQPDKCEVARDTLLDMIRVIRSVFIPKKHHSLVIGRKGETIKKISEENEVFITVPPWSQRYNENVTIIGGDENVVDRVCDQLKSITNKAKVQFSLEEILIEDDV